MRIQLETASLRLVDHFSWLIIIMLFSVLGVASGGGVFAELGCTVSGIGSQPAFDGMLVQLCLS